MHCMFILKILKITIVIGAQKDTFMKCRESTRGGGAFPPPHLKIPGKPLIS